MHSSSASAGTVCLCIRMRRAAGRITDFYDRMLASTGLTVNQYALLATISRTEGCGTGELARKVGQEKSTLVRTLQPLFRHGLIEDRSDKGKRRRQFHLTERGGSVMATALPLWRDAQAAIAGLLGDEYGTLLNILDGLDTLDTVGTVDTVETTDTTDTVDR